MVLVVQKFGGTSVANPDRMRVVADHVVRTRRRGNDVVVVISAMGKETDELLRLASEVSDTRPGREMDMLITAGERKATALLCMALHDMGVDAESFTGSQAGFITDTTHTNAKILEVRADRIRDALAEDSIVLVAGFQGVSTARDVTTLGRGGSDTTAVALAAAIGAPDPVRGEVVKAFVQLHPGGAATPDLARELQAWVRTRLSAHEYPREIEFIEAIPVTTTGKVRRADLRQLERRRRGLET